MLIYARNSLNSYTNEIKNEDSIGILWKNI